MKVKRREAIAFASCWPLRGALAQGPSLPTALVQSFDHELEDVQALSRRLGFEPQAAASAGDPSTISALDLAQTIDSALTRGPGNEDALNFATRAGLVLSGLSRADRDGFDLNPDEPAAAAAPAVELTQELRTTYVRDFKAAQVNHNEAEVSKAAQMIRRPASRQSYIRVSSNTQIPWWIIGALHYREASLNFMGHLHNGDPLLLKTIHVPKMRPPSPWLPPNTEDPAELWFLSACDAVRNLRDRVSDWTAIDELCYGLESYNGFGCYFNGVKSPYLWSYTDVYTGGGFPRDHEFSASYQSKQVGLIAIIKTLMFLEPNDIRLHS